MHFYSNKIQCYANFRIFIILFVCFYILFTPHLAYALETDSDDLRRDLDAAKAEIAELRDLVERLAASKEKAVIEPIELESRVDDIEEIAYKNNEKLSDRAVVSAFDATSFDIGGFFDAETSVVIGEDGATASFNRQVFELLAHADLGERWDFFVAQAFVRNAPLTFTDPDGVFTPEFGNNNSPVVTDTVIAWGQYHHSDQLNVQFGRYITPIGIINVEHFPASLLDTDQPMFLRPFPGQSLFANFTNGVNINGTFYTGASGQNTVEYSVFGGVWAGNSTNYTAGGRVRYNLGQSGFSFGANLITGDRSSALDDDRFVTVGADLFYDANNIIFKAEAFLSNESSGDNKYAFYVQPGYRLAKYLTGFYRFDYFDEGLIRKPRTEHVLGIVFDPISNVRLRGIYRRNSFSDELGLIDAKTNTFQLQTTLNF